MKFTADLEATLRIIKITTTNLRTKEDKNRKQGHYLFSLFYPQLGICRAVLGVCGEDFEMQRKQWKFVQTTARAC